MKVLKIVEPHRAVIEELPEPVPDQDNVLIKVMASGICGTDIHILRGEYLGEYPLIPGHEFSGIVQEVGTAVTRFKPGDRVAVEPNVCCNNCYNCLHNRQNFCLNWQAIGVTRPGAMAEFVTAPEENTFDIGTIPFETAAFMEPLSCTVHGLGKVDFSLSNRIAILGAGPIGLLMIGLVKRLGSIEVTVVEKNRARLELAGESGADFIEDDIDGLRGDYYDVVVDATGSIPVMRRTLEFVRHGGIVLLFGVPPMGTPMEIDPFLIFRKGLTILSSFTSVRNSYQAVSLLQAGAVDSGRLISHRLALEEFQRGVEIIEAGAEEVKKVMILPNG
jgi:2-desacetyl-2-hydroxyethyl bacteriochlorophyllide A dehydrogenase